MQTNNSNTNQDIIFENAIEAFDKSTQPEVVVDMNAPDKKFSENVDGDIADFVMNYELK